MSKKYFTEHKHSSTLKIVGFAKSTCHMAFETKGQDLFGLNEAHRQPWWGGGETGWFQIHPKFDYMRANNRNDARHWPWLQEDHDFPIYMQDQFDEIPDSVRFPLEACIDKFGMYFTSTPAYELALGVLMGYERIEIYGIEMCADSEYVYQKAGFEYLIGMAKGMGVDIYLPPACTLLRGNLYAYEDLRAASRTYYGFRERYMLDQVEKKTAVMNEYTGRMKELEDLLRKPEMRDFDPALRKWVGDRYVSRRDEHMLKLAEAAATEGALHEIQSTVLWHDSQSIPLDRVEVTPDEQA